MFTGAKFYWNLFGSIFGSLGDIERRKFITQQLIHAERLTRQRFDENFIFIHINKTGGSSVSEALKIERHHLSAFTVRNLIGEDAWKTKFKFAFVRNPWDRAVSQYHYRYKANQQNIRTDNIGFEDWLKKAFIDKEVRLINSHAMFMPQTDWISDMEGNIILDFVGRFENLSADAKYVFNKIGLNTELGHLRKSDRSDYKEYYEPWSVDLIAEVFAKDIEKFGYTFE